MINKLFCRNNIILGDSIEQPSTSEIKTTFSLWNASYDDAIRYGGSITRAAMKVMNIRHDRKYVVVDTKIHMLIKGMMPAIPGWHTDGVPRDKDKNPNGSELPDIFAQEDDVRPNRYHLLVTGIGCLTEFINRPMVVPIPEIPVEDVYYLMSKYVQGEVVSNSEIKTAIPSCTSVEFDWWNIHSGVIASKKEWRYLIRVCESDYAPPQTDLRQIIRTQNQVYAPINFGW